MHSNTTLSSQWLPSAGLSMLSSKDPYNYTLNDEASRKSMISKLPNHNPVDLGAYPEVALLFQAAEIERLSGVLAGSRLQHKDMNKEHLDRHSYQVQIKELTACIDQAKQQKLNLERRLDEMARSSRGSRAEADVTKLESKYERALLEIGKMYDDNTRLQDELNQLQVQLAAAKAKPTTLGSTTLIPASLDVIPEELKQRIVQQSTRPLRLQISQLQARNARSAAQLRGSFQKQYEEYRLRVEEQVGIGREELEEQNNQLRQKIRALEQEVQKVTEGRWELETHTRQQEIKARESELKLKSCEAELARTKQQIQSMSARMGSVQNSAYFAQPSQSAASLSLVNPIGLQQSLPLVHNIFSFNANEKMHSSMVAAQQQHLQNNVALLSQQLQRLTEILRNKNKQIEELQEKVTSVHIAHEKELIDLRIRYEGEMRREAQRRTEQSERLNNQIENYRRQLQVAETSTTATGAMLQEQFSKIRQQQRQACESLYSRRMESLSQQHSQARAQISRLRLQMSNLQSLNTQLAQKQLQARSQARHLQLEYLEKQQMEERRASARIKEIERQFEERTEGQTQKAKLSMEEAEREITKMRGILEKQAEMIRETQLRHLQQTKQISINERQVVQSLQRKTQELQKTLRDKQRQIFSLKTRHQSSSLQSQQLLRKQHELLVDKIEHLSAQTQEMKSTMAQVRPRSQGHQPELERIGHSLEYLSTQLTTLSKQIMEAHFLQTPRANNYYSEHYVKQLEKQCQNYLSIVNGKINSTEANLKRIWEQIEANNRYNREEQDKWRAMLDRKQDEIGQLRTETSRLRDMEFQYQKAKYDCARLQEAVEYGEVRLQEREEQLRSELIQMHEEHVQSYSARISQLSSEVSSKQKLIEDLSMKLNQASFSQAQQLTKMTEAIELKTRELNELSVCINEYRTKYSGTKQKLKQFEKVIERLIADAERDLEVAIRAEKQNGRLKAELEKAARELHMERVEKSLQEEKNRNEMRMITQQLMRERERAQAQWSQANQQKLNTMHTELGRLQQVVAQLRRQNYQLASKNYEGETQGHVMRQFGAVKVAELSKEIERLTAANIELSEEISRCRLQLSSEHSNEARKEENLGLMFLLFVEVQALRSRFNVP